MTDDYCYVCGAALTHETTRMAQIDGGETIIRICGHDDCAADERIYKLIGSAANYERWLNERWMVEHGGPDFDL